jgi:dolichol-phosphate mannosyltransferase
MKAVSVIVPTYNEIENLPVLIERIEKVFVEEGIIGEVVIIDDNSPDGTGQLAERLKEKYKFLRVIHRPSKLGLGSAYKEGFRVARGKLLFTMDADLSHDPAHIPQFIQRSEHADVVVGSRYVKGGDIIGWSPYRRLVSKIANFLAGIVVGRDVNDVTSGYRAYRREVLEKVPLEEVQSSGYAFQLEIIHEIRKKGFKIDSVPIVFTDRRKGRSKLGMREIVSFLMLTIKLGLRP